MIITLYLSFFSGLEEDFRFKGLDSIQEIDSNVIFYAKRLVLSSIQSENFYYEMIS